MWRDDIIVDEFANIPSEWDASRRYFGEHNILSQYQYRGGFIRISLPFPSRVGHNS